MTIWIVRHGCAGRKADWVGDDDCRPLDAAGRRQAREIADLLAGSPLRRLRSSPAGRCVDTLVPLSRLRGLPVERDERLRPGGHPGGLLGLVEDADAGDVLCTHGEVMLPASRTMRKLAPRDVPDDDRLSAKGVVWRIDVSPQAFAVHPTDPCPDHA